MNREKAIANLQSIDAIIYSDIIQVLEGGKLVKEERPGSERVSTRLAPNFVNIYVPLYSDNGYKTGNVFTVTLSVDEILRMAKQVQQLKDADPEFRIYEDLPF